MLIRILTTLVLFSGLMLSIACQKKDGSIVNGIYSEDLKDPSKIFSNRPLSYGKFVALFRLKNPSLFEELKTEQLKKTVNPELAKAIEEEQKAFIETIKAATPEVVVMMKYKYIVNGVAVLVSVEEYNKISTLANVAKAEAAQTFARPHLAESDSSAKGVNLTQNNSALFIGAKYALEKNIKGQGIRVGIIDTGIDYTHAMLGGSGVEADYKTINPALPAAAFPNQKVVGGYDFVGSTFGSNSNLDGRMPKPDANPIDEMGHGTHVAGTVGGIGDGVNSYDGVAPEAQLYALKVFGTSGGTSDEVVIAALEYSADPNGDGNIDDRLDVVNLSLGSSFGSSRSMYNLAIKNLTLGGTVVVASAGNSGDTSYIVGAPGITDEALSVAASVDGMDHNWKFKAIEFYKGSESMPAEFVEGAVSKKISEIAESKDKLVYIGLADKDLTPEQMAAVRGNIAVIDRGGNPFIEKLRRAEAAGALGAVVANNQIGDPFIMGGEGEPVNIPAVMIAKAMGDIVKAELAKGVEIFVQLKSGKILEKPVLIDTLANFSSRGPRGEDSLIKPEISAPGQQIISAAMGKGQLTVPMSGTSMSGPHMTGVMALMKQFYPELTVTELKSIVMGTATPIHDDKKKQYPVSRMGAGRVQIEKALTASIATSPASLSLGEVKVESKKVILKEVTVRNVRPEPITFKVQFSGHSAITVNETSVTLGSKVESVVALKISIDASKIASGVEEIDGFVRFTQEGKEIFRLPVLAIARKVSQLSAQSLKIFATSIADSDGALAEVDLKNESIQQGLAVPMNLIAVDGRKYVNPNDLATTSDACDIQAVGYKILKDKIYFGFKMYHPVTTWHACELSILFDADEDGKPDQELAGVPMGRLPGLPALSQFVSIMLDANKAQAIRAAFEASAGTDKPLSLNYESAVEDVEPMLPLNHSTVAVLVADISKIRPQKTTGKVSFKIASSSLEEYNVEEDDFLENDEKEWRSLDLTPMGQSYIFSDLAVQLNSKTQQKVTFTKGHGQADLMVLMPSNRTLSKSVTLDEQLAILKPSFQN